MVWGPRISSAGRARKVHRESTHSAHGTKAPLHLPDCEQVTVMPMARRSDFFGSRSTFAERGKSGLMLLSEDVFEGIAQLLGGSVSTGPAAAGQRRGPRAVLDTRLTIVPCPDGPERAERGLSVPVRDLSRGGLRFLHTERLPLDTPFVALLPRPRQLNPSRSEERRVGKECTSR